MYPILGRYGSFFLYSYTVVMGVGIAAGIGLTMWIARPFPRLNWLDGLLAGLLTGLAGGRIGFVWAQWSYFQERPYEIAQIWQGGLNYHGALLAGLLGLWAWKQRQRGTLATYAGLLAPGFALAAAFGWLACWLEGCAYGREVSIGAPIAGLSGLLAADLPDSFGVHAWRYQTQLLGLGLSLLVFFLVMGLRRRWRPGQLFWCTLLGLSSGRVIVSLLRGDAVPHWGQVRVGTFLDAVLAFISLVLFVKG